LKTAPVLFFRGRGDWLRKLSRVDLSRPGGSANRPYQRVPLCRLARYPPRRRTFPAVTRNDRIWRLCGPPWSRSARRN